jgi:hypothetical protein
MSGKFVCGIRKFDQHKMMASDRTTNQALFQENQKSLNDLIKMREEQDKGTWQPIVSTIHVTPALSSDANYTSWRTPTTFTN